MKNTFRPLRPLRVVAVALALVLVGAACSDNGVRGTYAAKVGDQTIAERDFLDELAQFRANEAATQAFGLEGEEGAVTSQLSAAWLNALIQDALFREEFDRRKLSVSDADILGAEQRAIQQFGGEQVWNGFDSWFRERVVLRLARVVKLQEQVAGDIAEADIRAEFEAIKGDLEQRTCVAHILVPSEEQALELKAQLEGGADFADLAGQHSTDPGSGPQGGELGCHPRNSFVAAFDAAAWSLPEGQVSDPIETQFGWHLVLVHSRGAPSFEDVRGEIESRLQQQSQEEFGRVMSELLEGIDIEVNPKYGTFDRSGATGSFVLPPGTPQVSDGPPPPEGELPSIPGLPQPTG